MKNGKARKDGAIRRKEYRELAWGLKMPPISVNLHLWPRCNYRCRFCFATFRGVLGAMSKEEAMRLLVVLRDSGTEKITLAGGEPTLCPYLREVIQAAKRLDMTTVLITNGTRITEAYLREISPWIDWIGLSVDSASNEVEASIGRGTGDHVDVVKRAAKLVKASGIRLKINTTVVAANWREDIHELMGILSPERWKIFQGLPIIGENEGFGTGNWATRWQFREFVRRHADLRPVSEHASMMEGSYLMVDPIGRFFQNFGRRYRYSDSIFEVGVEAALLQVGWDRRKFLRRGGVYKWRGFLGRGM